MFVRYKNITKSNVLVKYFVHWKIKYNGGTKETPVIETQYKYKYTLFYKNTFYKNIEAEICEILRIPFKNKPEAEILKRI